ncbi:DUF2914 domain-containing protein [Brumimicrobium aurantiacum]|uniref:DUF2914 domain-containing protein n=1 Tax=Brumimicrobium aurantiacum TaxID=1737063 RepID=A0A3E1EUW5_9FLAO|nr:DUF2914 domain-containing protein [Brumimicrobium aurantiacum]RFC53359.1 DUF2914 domain-containing protein [Brumimicrobium aurantiacum]
MNKVIQKYKNSRFRKFIRRNNKYLPLIFFIGGFIMDVFTLGRIDQAFSLVLLSTYLLLLSVTLYLYNLVDDGTWKNTFLERFELYFPLAIQFFLGSLSSAYVIYFSRSVSLSKTFVFFLILIGLFIANEFLKKRIANKYLQFSLFFFVNFTFFTFMVPVILKEMNTLVFLFSGGLSLALTLLLITFIYRKSPSTRYEINLKKLTRIILSIYLAINTFYFTNLIPPVPLALETGLVAHKVEQKNGEYLVTYEQDDWYVFWRSHRQKFAYKANERVYIFTSIFAPTELSIPVFHRWKKYVESTNDWLITDKIGYQITGGREQGFRGYTYKQNVDPGKWKVEVITEDEQILGVINFEIIEDENQKVKRIVKHSF